MSELAEVSAIVADYIELFHAGDGDKARAIFEPTANLYSYEKDKPRILSRDAYADYLVKRGPLPAELRAKGRPLSVNVVGPGLAVAIVEVFGVGRDYTDVLTLLKMATGWRIVTKTFAVVAA